MMKHLKLTRAFLSVMITASMLPLTLPGASAANENILSSVDCTKYESSTTAYAIADTNAVQMGSTDFWIQPHNSVNPFGSPLTCYFNYTGAAVSTSGIYLGGMNGSKSFAMADGDYGARKDDILEYRPANLSELSGNYLIKTTVGNNNSNTGIGIRFNMDKTRENYYIFVCGYSGTGDSNYINGSTVAEAEVAGGGAANAKGKSYFPVWQVWKIVGGTSELMTCSGIVSTGTTDYIKKADVTIARNDGDVTVTVKNITATGQLVANAVETKTFSDDDDEFDFSGSLIGFTHRGKSKDTNCSYVSSLSIGQNVVLDEKDDVIYANIAKPLDDGVMTFTNASWINRIDNNGSASANILVSENGVDYDEFAEITAGDSFINNTDKTEYKYLKFDGTAQSIDVYTPLDGYKVKALEEEIKTAVRIGGEDVDGYTLTSSNNNKAYVDGKTIVPIRSGKATITATYNEDEVSAEVTSISSEGSSDGEVVATENFKKCATFSTTPTYGDSDLRLDDTDLYFNNPGDYTGANVPVATGTSGTGLIFTAGRACSLVDYIGAHWTIDYKPDGLDNLTDNHKIDFEFRNVNATTAFGLRFNIDEDATSYYMFTCGYAGNATYPKLWYLYKISCGTPEILASSATDSATTTGNYIKGCKVGIELDGLGDIKLTVGYNTDGAYNASTCTTETAIADDSEEPFAKGGFAFVKAGKSATGKTELCNITITNGAVDDSFVYNVSNNKLKAYYDSTDSEADAPVVFIAKYNKTDNRLVDCAISSSIDTFNKAELGYDSEYNYKIYVWDLGDNIIEPILSATKVN